MNNIDQEYLSKHQKSARLFQESAEVFADGVTHDTRYVTPFPLVMTHASGPLKWDVDGNEYVDYVCGHGALILGHSHPAIAAAVAEQVGKRDASGRQHGVGTPMGQGRQGPGAFSGEA